MLKTRTLYLDDRASPWPRGARAVVRRIAETLGPGACPISCIRAGLWSASRNYIQMANGAHQAQRTAAACEALAKVPRLLPDGPRQRNHYAISEFGRGSARRGMREIPRRFGCPG